MEFDARVERCNISRAIRSEVYATYYWKFEREARRVETLTSCSTFTSPSPSRINFTLINPSWESRPCRWKLRNEGRRKININLIQTGRTNVQWKIRNFKFHFPPGSCKSGCTFRHISANNYDSSPLPSSGNFPHSRSQQVHNSSPF